VPRLRLPCAYADSRQLAYTLVFLQKGELPWDGDEDGGTAPADELCEGLDPVFVELVRWARGLVHGEDPQHARLRARLAAAWVRAGFGDALGHVDWWAEYSRVERAAAEAAARLPYIMPLPPSPPPEPAMLDDVYAEPLGVVCE
jgi:hypothetical protein